MPVRIYQTDGRLVTSVDLDFVDNRALLDVTALGAGIYVVVGEDGNGNRRFQEKLVRY